MYNRLLWLILSRFIILLVLLGMAVILNILVPESFTATLLIHTFTRAIIATLVLSTIYSLAIRYFNFYLLQAYGQIFIDIILVSWIVYETAAIDRSFAALYLVIVLAAITVLPRSGVLIVSLLSVLSYTIVLGLLHYGILNQQPLYLDPARSAPLYLYILAILFIGILGGQISQRLVHSHLELTRTTLNLVNLQAFNERIIESIHSGLVTTDTEGKILSFNRAAEEITGYRAHQVLSRNFSEIFGDNLQGISFGKEALKLSRPIRLTTICLASNKRQMHLGITASALYSKEGDVTGLIFSFQDLTEIIKLEQEVRHRDRLAAMGKMAAGIAHEIRNPLAAMRGSIQVLRSELDLNEDQAYLMQIVLRESDRLDKIVSDFLTYARPTPPNLIEFDLTALIDETISLLRHSSELENNHQITTKYASQPFLFVADHNQIRQVIWNLARNALQAMPNGGMLKIELEETPQHEAKFSFTDTGVGLPQNKLESMFEPFNSSRPGGTGLGLAIVYQIVKDHNGRVTVESELNIGTKITIYLPHPHEAGTGASNKELSSSSLQ